MAKKFLLAIIVSALIFSACKKENEELKPTALSEYVPLEVGKYIIYQLDSFRYPPFSTQGIIIGYQVKFLVDAAITDNLGRPAYRIVRYIRQNSSDPWVPDHTSMAVNTENRYELIDNNQRFIKLALPIENGYSWKGNSYIDVFGIDPATNEDFDYLDNRDYTYDSLNAPLTLGAITIDSTVKVGQLDEVLGNPDDPGSYAEKNSSVEYYAKGIGLIYKRFFHSVFQPTAGLYSDDSKGITLTMIDHN